MVSMQLSFIFANGIGVIQLLKSELEFQWSSWYNNVPEEGRHTTLAAGCRDLKAQFLGFKIEICTHLNNYVSR